MFLDIFSHITPLTKLQAVFMITLSFLVYGEIASKYDMYFNFEKIFVQMQVWRLLTSVYYVGDFDIITVLKIALFLQFAMALEKSGFKRGSVDYLYFNILVLVPLYVTATIFKIYSLNDIYTFVLYYLNGRKERDQLLIINFIPIRGPYLVWYLVFLNWVVRKLDITENLISIFVGHTFYFFSKVNPKLPFSNKVNYLDTPDFFVRIFSPFFNGANNQRAFAAALQQQLDDEEEAVM